MNPTELGRFYQMGGHYGERIIGDTLENLGYNITFPPSPNQQGFDLLAVRNHRRYVIQVKTDMNNDGNYVQMTPEQIVFICNYARNYNFVPILVHYNPYTNRYIAYYINSDKMCNFE